VSAAKKLDSATLQLSVEGVTLGVTSSEARYTCPKSLVGKNLSESEVWLDVGEAVTLLGISKVQVHRNRKAGKYTTKMVSGNGGKQYRIALSSLPVEAQRKYYDANPRPLPSDAQTIRENSLTNAELTDWQREYALVRYAVLRAYQESVKTSSWGSTLEVKNRFCERYNNNLLPQFGEAHRKYVKKASFKTLDRWQSELDDAGGDPFALAPGFGRHRGRSRVTDTEASALRKYAMMPNRLLISEVIAAAKKEVELSGGVVLSSDMTLRRWVNRFRSENYHLWQLSKGEKCLNDRCLPYLERDRSQVAVGDILVADGHVFNFDVLDPLTGRAKRMMLVLVFDFKSNMPVGWEIAATENTAAISAAYERAIRTLGFVPRIFYLDNGRAFRSKFFTKTKDFSASELPGLFERLKPHGYIETIFAWPYHGQSKTVERFFGYMASFERQVSSYRGNSVANKVARIHRNEKLHTRLYERFTGGSVPTVSDVHGMMMEWFKEYAQSPSGKNSALKGAKPIDVFESSLNEVRSADDFAVRQVSDDELRYLMMAARTTAIYQNGIKFNGRHYWNEALYGYQRGKKALVVRYDMADLSRIYVYDESGKFICDATADRFGGMHPAARQLGTAGDVKRLSDAIEEKRALKQATINIAEGFYGSQMQVFKTTEKQALKGNKMPKKSSKSKKGEVSWDEVYDTGDVEVLQNDYRSPDFLD